MSKKVETVQVPEAEEMAEDKREEQASKYVVSVARRAKSGARTVATVHSRTGCWRGRNFTFSNYELLETTPHKEQYDMVCRLCWPSGPPDFAVGAVPDLSSSSSSSSE